MYIYENLQKQLQKFGNTQNLMSYFTDEEFKLRHKILKAKKAAGIDKVTKEQYDTNLDDNIQNLVSKLKSGSYCPKPVLRCYIPKSNGKLRALGISAYEDKLVQSIMTDILVSIYEVIFLKYSYGYRPNKNCHSALQQLSRCVCNKSTKFIIEADIKGFFDNLNQDKLIEMLQPVIQDRHFINYIKKFLKCGIIDKGRYSISNTGTPQGTIFSPVLGNVYLHYALDIWFEEVVKSRFRNCELIRYCDDFIICCDSEANAKLIIKEVKHRLADYELQLEPSKTRIIDADDCTSSSHFNFLGFNVTIENSKCSLTATFNKTIKKQQHISDMIANFQNEPVEHLISSLNFYLGGIYQYYAISTNLLWVQDLYLYTLREMHKVLCEQNRPMFTHHELYLHLLAHPLLEPPEVPLFYI